MMRRKLCESLLLVFIIACSMHLHRAAAQTPIGCDLGVVLMEESDTPGYRLAGESKTTMNGGIAAALTRTFMNRSTQAVLSSSILVLNSRVSSDLSSPSTGGRAILQSFATGTNADAGSFHTTGQLGIGEDDLSAVWTVQGRSLTVAAYADVFSRGPLLVIVAYLAPIDSVDATQLGAFAQIQDSKLLSADLSQVAGACSQNSGR